MQTINIKLWYTRFKGSINIKYLILLVLAGLHHHKKITDDKLKGQLHSLRKGELQKFKGTYHCTINGRWYNDEPAYEVFLDCIDEKWLSSIPYDAFLTYLHLFENKNFNYALNIFGSEYIFPMFQQWDPEYCTANFADFIEFYIPKITTVDRGYNCYECGHHHSAFDKNSDKNIIVINDWIHNQKKGNLAKIPKNDISQHNFNYF